MTKKYIQGAGGNPSPPQPPQPTRTPDTYIVDSLLLF